MIKQIISGGQPGVEIAALDAAIQLDIPHAGWAYKGRKTEDGVLPEKYNVKGIDNPSYFERLDKNLIDSEGTVILTHGQFLIGLKGVRALAEKHKKPCLHVELEECTLNHAISSIRKWMLNHEIEVVYFTGPKPVGGASKIYRDVILIIEGICGVEREQEMFLGFQEDDDPEKF
jgi:hypothetical protein